MESDVHLPVNIGNPNEFTLLERGEDRDRGDRVALRDRLRGAVRPTTPSSASPTSAAPSSCSAGSRRWTCARASSARSTRRASRASSGRPSSGHRPQRLGAVASHRAPDGDLPSLPGRSGQHLLSLRARAGRARPPRRGLHRPGRRRGARRGRRGRAPHPARVRDRKRAADPAPRRAARLRRAPPPLPVHVRRRADDGGAGAPGGPRPGAARPLQEPHRRPRAPAGDLRDLRAHGGAASDPQRRAHLRALARPRRVGALPALGARAHPGARARDAQRRRHRGVLPRRGRGRGCASASASAPTPWSPRSSRPSTAPTTSSDSTSRSRRSRAPSTRSTSSSPGTASCCEGYRAAARDAGVGERVHFLGRLPAGAASGGPARQRPDAAHDRAARSRSGSS